ncbi:DsrE/DsrF/DrsH-like family protein [Staphylococcus equorum]
MKQYSQKHINDLGETELARLASEGQLIDVRTEEEYELGHINGSILHPVDNIETFNYDKNKNYYIHCKSGNRSAKVSEYLSEQNYDVVNLEGGYQAYAQNNVSEGEAAVESTEVDIKSDRKQFNYSNLQCPGPIVNISKEVKNIQEGDQMEVTVTDPGFSSDIKSWVKQTGHTLVNLNEDGREIKATIQKEQTKDMEVNHTDKGTTIVLFSGELDKAVAAMIIANGAKAAGRDVTIFFTFWGLNALKKEKTSKVRKQGIAKMFDLMLPKSPLKMPLSKMNMFGLGNVMMRYVMKKKNVDSLPSLINQAIDQKIKLIACTMSMDVMGIKKEELRDEVSYGGVGTYIGDTENASHNLFI